jgi:hypothetical protein
MKFPSLVGALSCFLRASDAVGPSQHSAFPCIGWKRGILHRCWS